MTSTHIVIGGGSAGCVVAARLSERPENRVILIEAGNDYRPAATPADLLDTYPGKALANPDYFWKDLKVYRSGPGSNRPPVPPEKFEQAKVIGGGSSINGQVALRGQRRDYDGWRALGCEGWGWKDVEPYFARLETDRDFETEGHGQAGPISIRRIERSHWDEFSLGVIRRWQKEGLEERPDMNGPDGGGYSPLPLSNDGERRASAALGYLTDEVRARPNLEIRANARALRLIVEDGTVTGVEIEHGERVETLMGDRFALCAGAIFTPWLLMRSGIGPGEELRAHGIEVERDLPGVGRNLLDHPSISLTAYLVPEVRRRPILRHNYINGVYSSGLPDCPENDMVQSVVCRSAWHPVGQRLGTVSCYVGKSFSRGRVRLSRAGPDAYPEIYFNWASDPRDMQRLMIGFRRVAAMFSDPDLTRIAKNPFASSFSDRVRSINRNSPINRLLTRAAAFVMDHSDFGRRLLIERTMTAGVSLPALLADDEVLREHVLKSVWGLWHPSGTCRMGPQGDEESVVTPDGKVKGFANLFVADASVFPDIPTYNINIPTIMVAERVADLMKAA